MRDNQVKVKQRRKLKNTLAYYYYDYYLVQEVPTTHVCTH